MEEIEVEVKGTRITNQRDRSDSLFGNHLFLFGTRSIAQVQILACNVADAAAAAPGRRSCAIVGGKPAPDVGTDAGHAGCDGARVRYRRGDQQLPKAISCCSCRRVRARFPPLSSWAVAHDRD